MEHRAQSADRTPGYTLPLRGPTRYILRTALPLIGTLVARALVGLCSTEVLTNPRCPTSGEPEGPTETTEPLGGTSRQPNSCADHVVTSWFQTISLGEDTRTEVDGHYGPVSARSDSVDRSMTVTARAMACSSKRYGRALTKDEGEEGDCDIDAPLAMWCNANS